MSDNEDWADKKAQEICKNSLAHELREAYVLGHQHVLITVEQARKIGFREGIEHALAHCYHDHTLDTLRHLLHEEVAKLRGNHDNG